MSYEIRGPVTRPDPTIGDMLRRLKNDPGHRNRIINRSVPVVLGFLALCLFVVVLIDSSIRVVAIIQ